MDGQGRRRYGADRQHETTACRLAQCGDGQGDGHREAGREETGWNLKRFVAVGNNGSDLTMLEASGQRVAVGEREPSLVEIAHGVLSPDDHPIEACVKRYFVMDVADNG